MSRLERRIFKLNDRLAELDLQIGLVSEELAFHRHLNDDAQRDAVVSEHEADRAEARQIASDVARFERVLAELEEEKTRLTTKRSQLLSKL